MWDIFDGLGYFVGYLGYFLFNNFTWDFFNTLDIV